MIRIPLNFVIVNTLQLIHRGSPHALLSFTPIQVLERAAWLDNRSGYIVQFGFETADVAQLLNERPDLFVRSDVFCDERSELYLLSDFENSIALPFYAQMERIYTLAGGLTLSDLVRKLQVSFDYPDGFLRRTSMWELVPLKHGANPT